MRTSPKLASIGRAPGRRAKPSPAGAAGAGAASGSAKVQLLPPRRCSSRITGSTSTNSVISTRRDSSGISSTPTRISPIHAKGSSENPSALAMVTSRATTCTRGRMVRLTSPAS